MFRNGGFTYKIEENEKMKDEIIRYLGKNCPAEKEQCNILSEIR